MKRTDFAFDLPPELIAQAPLAERSASRLLSVDGNSGECSSPDVYGSCLGCYPAMIYSCSTTRE